MYSVQTPILSIGSNVNPRSCTGDGLFEWVFNNNSVTSSLVRVRKSTYIITDTINTTSIIGVTQSNSITYGNGYVFIPSSISYNNISRYSAAVDGPVGSGFQFTVNRTASSVSSNLPFISILSYGGFLWCPIQTSGSANNQLIRLDVFNNLTKTTYSYNTDNNTSDTSVTVFTNLSGTSGLDGVAGATQIFGYGGYIYTLRYNPSASPIGTTIVKINANIPRNATGIVSSGTNYIYYYYSAAEIRAIASDNISNVWFCNSTNSNIYRTSLFDSANSTTLPASFFSTGLTSSSINAMTYGVGYLWIYGKSGTTSVLLQRDVVNNVTLRTITLPTNAFITCMDIYNQFLWMTDSLNSTLLKMQVYIPCFKEDSKILCLTSQMTEEYIPIQYIRKGTLVKTYRNGYVPVDMIGKSVISNPGGNSRIKNKLYKCTKENYPDLIEDLYITGCHSILVQQLTEEQTDKTIDALDKIYMTDGKYRLMAYLDDRAIPYEKTGSFNIWHLALENDDYYMNYGIYANGLLVESTSKRYMKELSGLELV